MRLSAFFFTALAILLIHMSSHADVVSKLDNCSIPGRVGISTPFVNCINRNFRLISESLNLSLSSCPNLGEEVTTMYASCIKKSFDTIDRQITR